MLALNDRCNLTLAEMVFILQHAGIDLDHPSKWDATTLLLVDRLLNEAQAEKIRRLLRQKGSYRCSLTKTL